MDPSVAQQVRSIRPRASVRPDGPIFREDRRYPEKEVNQRLAIFHPDVAALRRYFVDERYEDREIGLYWRRKQGG
jgi:hypothetical protein